MQENKYYRLIKYMKNVFDIEELLRQLEDGRVNPTYTTETAILIILMGFLLRLSSFSEIDILDPVNLIIFFHLELSYHA